MTSLLGRYLAESDIFKDEGSTQVWRDLGDKRENGIGMTEIFMQGENNSAGAGFGHFGRRDAG